MNLRELSSCEIDRIRDKVNALTRDLAYLDLIRNCSKAPNTGHTFEAIERSTSAYVELAARELAELLK